MTTTIVSGPDPSGLSTLTESRYWVNTDSPSSVWLCSDNSCNSIISRLYSYRGCRICYPDLLGLARAGISWSVGDQVALELSVYCVQARSTPRQVDGGGGRVVSCHHARLTTWLCNTVMSTPVHMYGSPYSP